MFSGGYRMRAVARNGLMHVSIYVKPDWFGEMILLYEKKLEKRMILKFLWYFSKNRLLFAILFCE